MIIDLTFENYQDLIKEDKILIFDYYTPSCSPCKSMFPVLEKLDEKYSGKIIIIKVNASDPKFQDLVLEDSIRAVPTFIIKKDGRLIQKFTGLTDKTKFEKIIDDL